MAAVLQAACRGNMGSVIQIWRCISGHFQREIGRLAEERKLYCIVSALVVVQEKTTNSTNVKQELEESNYPLLLIFLFVVCVPEESGIERILCFMVSPELDGLS